MHIKPDDVEVNEYEPDLWDIETKMEDKAR